MAEELKKADIHIHIIGNVDEGCYVSDSLTKMHWVRLTSRWLGLNASAPETYTEKLVRYIRESPIDVGVILAYDAVYNDRGELDGVAGQEGYHGGGKYAASRGRRPVLPGELRGATTAGPGVLPASPGPGARSRDGVRASSGGDT